MIKRYSLTIVAWTLLVLFYASTLLPFLLFSQMVQRIGNVTVFLTWAGLVLLSLLPALSYLTRKIWFIEGQGAMLPLEKLQQTLLGFNNAENPVHCSTKKKKIIANWNYEEKTWCLQMHKAEISKFYELHLEFHEAVKTVIVRDRVRSLDILYCPDLKLGFWAKPSLTLWSSYSPKRSLAIATDYTHASGLFKHHELKSMVVGTIVENGWSVRYSLL